MSTTSWIAGSRCDAGARGAGGAVAVGGGKGGGWVGRLESMHDEWMILSNDTGELRFSLNARSSPRASSDGLYIRRPKGKQTGRGGDKKERQRRSILVREKAIP
jgi:hypothetical protein